MSTEQSGPRLGYLLKHVQLRYSEVSAVALEPLGITGRETAVLLAIAGRSPVSQAEIAAAMDVDRTTMVALIDDLQGKGLVERRQDPDDRRKNAVGLTEAGRDAVGRAAGAVERTEREFLGPLSAAEAAEFRRMLQALLGSA